MTAEQWLQENTESAEKDWIWQMEAYAAHVNKELTEKLGWLYDKLAKTAAEGAEAEAAVQELVEALELMYEHTADYIRINHLGDVHHNVSMQVARAALAKYQPKEKP